MTTTRRLSTPVALGDILDAITQTRPDADAHPRRLHPASVASTPSPAVPVVPAVPSARPTPDTPAYALSIGIDWADDHHDVCVLDPATQQRTAQTLTHDPAVLHAWLTDLHRQHPGRKLAVALEQKTGSLLNLLVEDEGLDLYPMNPAMVATYRKAFHPSGTKTDPGDANLSLDLLTLHRDNLTVLRPDDPLTRKRRDAVNLRTQFSNRLRRPAQAVFPCSCRSAARICLRPWPATCCVSIPRSTP